METEKILQFLSDLKENNHRDWMEANKPVYKEAREIFKDVVSQILKGVSEFDPGIAGLEAKDCIFRLNRDIRFSKDKSPYKLNFGASMSSGGRKSPMAGYYLHLMPGNNFVGGGMYMPEASVLKKVRQEIDYNGAKLNEIVNVPGFKKVYGEIQGDKLKTAPRDYPKDHEFIELLKMKSLFFLHQFTDDEVRNGKFIQSTVKYYETLLPFITYLNTALD